MAPPPSGFSKYRCTQPARDSPLTRALGAIALVGIAFITVSCLLVQFLRTDLNWITTSMSIYVTGPYDPWVRASFYAPAPGIAALGIGWYRVLDRHAHSVFPLILFIIGAIAPCILASFVADAMRWPMTLHGRHPPMGGVRHVPVRDHRRVAPIAAPALRSMLARGVHRSHHDRVGVRGLFLNLCAVADSARLGEKAVVALVLAWLWRAAWWLLRGSAR
ncbi:MAG TPA: hypothetical protein VJ833_08925 [Rhodanobacteraceae bacterium]|nr:hypothetical protein [Rhodanobacteraceae bacterium]